jgi:hypothetical protein
MSSHYRQQLPALGLSLEHGTESTPDGRGWFLFRDGELLGRYASKASAQEAWKALLKELGWQPRKVQVDASEALRRAAVERWARNRAG